MTQEKVRVKFAATYKIKININNNSKNVPVPLLVYLNKKKNIDRRNLFRDMEGPSLKVLKRRTYGIYVKYESTVTVTTYIHQYSIVQTSVADP
jgi:hypothetical protein